MKTNPKNIIPLILLFGIILYTLNSCEKEDSDDKRTDYTGITGTVTDVDGNVYITIGIGSQIWMAQNLNVTHYRNGDPIPNVTENAAWNSATSGAYCNYDNDLGYSTTYGKLYNWYAVSDNRNIAPVGWHVPTDDEWDTLINFVGGEHIAGSKLKEIGNTHWISGNFDATNDFAFQGIPGGWRLNLGDFMYLHERGYFWTQSNDFLPGGYAYSYGIHKDSTSVTDYATIARFGLSIRCVKDK